jgi:succinyl-diaminopimelate desuccinylase
MKGGLAAMMCAVREAAEQSRVRVLFLCVPDEESEDIEARSTDALVAAGLRGDFVITGEPTDLHIGVEAKGVLAVTVEVVGRAAHGSTPWLGDNAILKAHDAFRRIETLPFSRKSSELFDRPSINLARIHGGDAFNKVPDSCVMDVDIRYLPGQDQDEILAQIQAIPDLEVVRCFTRVPAIVARTNPYVLALREAVGRSIQGEALSVGRDGASDAGSFLAAGMPAVEFGPVGGGHHGPEEWVSVVSLGRYRQALVDFIHALPGWLEREHPPELRAVEGGLA